MHRPKLMIKKKVMLDEKGHYRYYSANYNPAAGKLKGYERPKSPIIDLEKFLNIKTEKQLIYSIYKQWGEGEYLIFGFVKGKKGTWVFWKGVIMSDGFLRERRITNYQKAINKIKTEMLKADEDEKEFLQDDINLEKELKTTSFYGFSKWLLTSSKLGVFAHWEDDVIINKPKFESWSDNKTEVTQEDTWGVNISKTKKNREQFEKW